MSEYKVVCVSVSDYERVLDIHRDVYMGNDYMPAQYHHLFHRSRVKSYALESNNLLVSFVLFVISDDGEEVITMGVRVRPSHQGQGLSVDRNPALRDRLRADLPSVKREIYSSVVLPECVKKISSTSILYSWFIAVRSIDIQNMLLSLNSFQCTNVTRLSFSRIRQILNETDKFQQFFHKFSESYIPTDISWAPIRIQKQELKRLFSTTEMLFTFSEGKQIVEMDLENIDILSLSYVSFCPVLVGIRVDMYFYGNPGDLLNHTVQHMRHTANIYDGPVRLAVHLPSELDKEEAISLLKSIYFLDDTNTGNQMILDCVICTKDF